MSWEWLTDDEVLTLYYQIIKETGGTRGILDQGQLESTLSRPKNLYAYGDGTESIYDYAASYMYGLIRNHCFVDGNKRIGFIATFAFLGANRIEIHASQQEVVNFCVYVASTSEPQEKVLREIAQWLENHCQEKDN